MPTSGTYLFGMSIGDVIDEACERSGQFSDHSVMKNSPSVKRSLNLLMIEWENQGIRQWLIEQVAPITLQQGVAQVPLAPQAIDILDMVIVRNGLRVPMTEMSRSEYLTKPNITTQGKPFSFMVDRQRDGPLLFLWPVPQNSTDQIIFDQFRYAQDYVANTDNPDVPRLALEALISGLAAKLARKRKDEAVGKDGEKTAVFDPARARELEALAAVAFKQFKTENRERADTTIYGRYS